MAYGMGMGGMGGSLDISKFSQFWIYAPLVISIICVIAAWFPVSNGSKIRFAICLFAAAALSSLLDHDGILKEKFYTILLGTAPLSILLASWLVSGFSNKNSQHKC